MFPLAVESEWSIVGQEFRELKPGESYETVVVSAPDALDHVAPEMTWRLRLRTDINQTDDPGRPVPRSRTSKSPRGRSRIARADRDPGRRARPSDSVNLAAMESARDDVRDSSARTTQESLASMDSQRDTWRRFGRVALVAGLMGVALIHPLATLLGRFDWRADLITHFQSPRWRSR